jgi:subfamily B ATP-binding cassette protein MsbA
LTFAAKVYAEYLRARFLRDDQARLIEAYSRMDYPHYASRSAGHFINIATRQLTGFYGAFGSFVALFSKIVSTLTYLGLAIFVVWRFSVAAVGGGVALLLMFRRLNVYVRTLSRKAVAENGRLTKRLIQFLHAFKYLTAIRTRCTGHGSRFSLRSSNR